MGEANIEPSLAQIYHRLCLFSVGLGCECVSPSWRPPYGQPPVVALPLAYPNAEQTPLPPTSTGAVALCYTSIRSRTLLDHLY